MKKIIYSLLIIMLLFSLVGCKHEHEYSEEIVLPTCIDEGYTKFTCECGQTYNENIIPANGHSYDEWKVVEEATEEKQGLMESICSVCLNKATEFIPKLEHTHNYSVNVVAPSCTKEGYTEYTCRCGDTYVENYTDMIDHKYGDFVIDKEPTYYEEGMKSKYCEVCNHQTEITSIEKLNSLEFVSYSDGNYLKTSNEIHVTVPAVVTLSFTYYGQPISNDDLIITYNKGTNTEVYEDKINITKAGRLLTDHLKAVHKNDPNAICEFTITGYPDLGGYPLKVAVDKADLKKFNPFLENYSSEDKEAKQRAISEVEKLFNCKIQFMPYPDNASLGAYRWNYIINQASLGISDFDFIYIPQNKVSYLYEFGVPLNLDQYYYFHGQKFMTDEQIEKVTVNNSLRAIFPDENEKFNVFMMPVGCDYYYYNSNCNAENSFFAFMEVILRTNNYLSVD